MTNDERDTMIRATHDAVIVMVKDVENHNDSLYGNGKDGLVQDVTLLQERQEKCPARKATTMEGKRMTVSHIMMAIAIISLITTIMIHFMTA